MDITEDDPMPRMAFTSCRLCTEKRGHYMIIPHTRMQIKSFFGINVKPLDGLPQLICEDCQITLTEHDKMKRKIKERQKSLLTNLKNQQQQDNHGSAQQADRDSHSLPIVENNTKILACNSQTSSTYRDSCKRDTRQQRNIASTAKKASIIKKKVVRRPKSLWKKDYIEYFVCRFCSKSYKQKKSIVTHLEQCKLKVRYSNVVQNCYVKLNRMGSRPNLTSSNENVVYGKDNIIHFVNKNYYVMYTLKDGDFTTTEKGKKRRLNSTGSNETLLIERNSCNKSQHSDDGGEKTREDEVIHISDSEYDDMDDSEFVTVYQII